MTGHYVGALIFKTARRNRFAYQPQEQAPSGENCATAACDVAAGLAGRGLRVWDPRSRAEHQCEQKKLVVRYLLRKIASGLIGGSFSYSFARCSNPSSRFT
jgi:hypothetical protein